MTRHLLDFLPRDKNGVAVPGVTIKAYPWALGATFISQAASGEWSFNAATAPTESVIYASSDSSDATAVAGNALTSFPDGSVLEAYLDEGLYIIVASVIAGAATRYDVNPKYEVGDSSSAALTTLEARMVAVEAREDAGDIIGSGATHADLIALRDASAVASPSDIYFLTADDIGTGTAEAPQYPAGEYSQAADDTIILRREDADADAAVDELINNAGAPTGAVPSGAKQYTDTDTGQEYIPDPVDPTAWSLKPTPAAVADPASMTFSI